MDDLSAEDPIGDGAARLACHWGEVFSEKHTDQLAIDEILAYAPDIDNHDIDWNLKPTNFEE